MAANIQTYLDLLTSEHNQRPMFRAMVAAICQASVDQQNQLAAFPSLFDIDPSPITLDNPDFNTGTAIPPFGWVYAGVVNPTLSYVSAFPYTGTQSLKIIATDHYQGIDYHPSNLPDDAQLVDVEMPCLPGQNYTISAALKYISGGMQPRVILNFYDVNGNFLSFIGANAVLTDNNWHLVSATGTVPQPAVSMVLSVDCEYITTASTTTWEVGLVTIGLSGAAGDQEDKLGQWIGVTRKLNQAIDDPSASDDFNRPDGNLGPNWSPADVAGLSIISHTAQAISTHWSGSYFSGSAFPNNQFSKATISSGDILGPAVRMSAPTNFYALTPYSGGLYIWKVAVGVQTILAVAAYTPIGGDVLTLEVIGTTLTGKVNGQAILSVVDTTFATGAPGIAAFNGNPGTGAALNWSGGPLPGITVLDDDDYRILLKLFIAQNQWDGTTPGIYDAWNSIFASEGFQILVGDNQDMTMVIVLLNAPTNIVILSIVTQGYFLLVPAGVLLEGFFEPSIVGIPIFGFDVENSTISGWDVGAWMIPVNI